MKISSNIIRFYNAFGIYKTIDVFSEAGFEAIDFNCDIKEFHNGSHDKDFYLELKKYALDRGIVFGQTHAPFASTYVDENLNAQRFDEIVRSMRYSSYLEAPYMVVHSCQRFIYSEANRDAIYEHNLNFYKRFIPFYEEYGVKIAIENTNQNGKPSLLSTAEMLNTIYNDLDNEAFSICYDIGHSNMIGLSAADEIRTLGNKIGCLHVHDNDGIHDTHTIPYYGTVNWDEVISALAEVDYKGTLNYEASTFVAGLPEDLYRDGAKYMATVARSIAEKIEKCRNKD